MDIFRCVADNMGRIVYLVYKGRKCRVSHFVFWTELKRMDYEKVLYVRGGADTPASCSIAPSCSTLALSSACKPGRRPNKTIAGKCHHALSCIPDRALFCLLAVGFLLIVGATIYFSLEVRLLYQMAKILMCDNLYENRDIQT